MTRPLDVTAVAAYSDEVRISVPAIMAALDTLARDPLDRDAAQEAFRLIHALKGAAAMVGLAALAYLLNHAEVRIEVAMGDEGPFPAEVVAHLRETVPQFPAYLETALAGGACEPIAVELSRSYRAAAGEPEGEDTTLTELLALERGEIAASSVPERTATPAFEEPAPIVDAAVAEDAEADLVPAEPIPPELAEVFAQESQEHLQTIAKLTSEIAAANDGGASLLELRRAVHTIKGAAGVVGYKAAARLAHRMEDLLDALADGTATLTPEGVRLLASSADMLDDLITGQADPATARQALVRLLSEYATLCPAAPVVAPTAPAAPASATPGAPPTAAPSSPVFERRKGNRDRRQGDDRRSGQQVVRVPFERLNELVRVVSELVLNRTTFDQHYAVLVEQVDELRLSTSRLRRATQKLETEYEVRALAGRGGFNGPRPALVGGHGFDELEFDRYTDFHLLTRELTETASDIATVSTRLGDTIGDFDGDLTRLGRLTREVQDKAMEFRMVPLVTLAARLERTVRVTAQECGKDAELALEGESVALDKSLLEEMADALVHLLRNAVDHGIDTPAVREAAGKPARGRIIVRAYHEGTDVVIDVEDDGSGLDLERIRRTAVDKGYVTMADAANLDDEELAAMVFEPGFSTAARISEVSGRGVGLDVVKTKVMKLGGRVRISSRPGAGATVTVRVPMTLAITRVLLVRAGGQTLGLPLGAIAQIVRADAANVARVGSDRVVNVDDRTYPLRELAEVLGLPSAGDSASQSQPVLITNLGGRRLALAVDQIVQTRDAVVKTLGTHLRRIQGVWGATLLGDGRVVLILNPTDLASGADESKVRRPVAHPRRPSEREARTVLVVDDSLSMRHVLSSVIKKAGWEPLQARDGVEALELLHAAARLPDLVLLDIEMPRMDGYEFLGTVRGQAAYRNLPVVMLTSRGGEKHREKAMSLGASGYVVKPFQEEALLQTMTSLMRGERRAAS